MAAVTVRICGGDDVPDAFRPLWDALSAYHLWLRVGGSPPVLPDWESERASLVATLGDGADGFVIVAERDGELIGYARVSLGGGGPTVWPPVERVAKLETLSVARPSRGQGVGGQLVEAAARETAIRRAPVLFVGFWRENLAAKRFYERNGFRADSRGRHRRPCR